MNDSEGATGSDGCFQQLDLRSRYRPDDRPRDTFLLPMLARAAAYDRAAGFFSSSSLAIAAAGLEPFVRRGGSIRLVVNHQLADRDVEAVERGLSLRDAVETDLGKTALSEADVDDVGPEGGLRLLATLVALEQLDIKVAVATAPDGRPLTAAEARPLHHSKFGVFADSCEPPCRVAFEGSNNESASGWLSNYETYGVYREWWPQMWDELGAGVVADFERHWEGPPPSGWSTFDVPDAKRRDLISQADPTLVRQALESQGRADEIEQVVGRILEARGEQAVPDDPMGEVRNLLAAPRQTAGVGIGSTVVEPWPHQGDVARKVVAAWPCSRLFADEVGLGKTIEVGLILRELLVSGTAQRVLLLVPASVMEQWQNELWEKFTLPVPRLQGRSLVWPEGSRPDGELSEPIAGERWDAADVMLASSHLARRASERHKLTALGWDLVVVDEAHHARRRGGDPKKNDPNALLQLLRRMRDGDCWDGLLLATATPMQMHPVEAYDLLDLLGLPGPHPDFPDEASWEAAGADGFVRYYEQLAEPDAERRDWPLLMSMARSHFAAHPGRNPHLEAAIEREVDEGRLSRRAARRIVRFGDPKRVKFSGYQKMTTRELEWLDVWLREHTPMRTLVHRATRHLLRAYQHAGILDEDVTIPRREIVDEPHVRFDEAEQELYDRIDDWIRGKYAAVQAAGAADNRAKALGFILTVYRRRLTSSFQAVTESLRKRRAMLTERHDGLVGLAELLDDDDRLALEDVPDGLESLLDPDVEPDHVGVAATELLGATGDEIAELDQFIADLETRPRYDSKIRRLVDDLRLAMGNPKPNGTTRQAIVFTQFTDTMDVIREQLAAVWPGQVGCYSGRGGEAHEPATGRWTPVDRQTVKGSFTDGELRVLVGTDAMSEGLNLQNCDLMVNADLPWNFMRIEQRIGRIDRIGGHPTVHVLNLLIEGTVEERIYSGIKSDFANFEDIVGAAQPVLAQTEDAIKAAAFTSGPDRDTLLEQQAQALIEAAQDAEVAPVNLDTFQSAENAWRPADPLPGEQPGDGPDSWIDTLRETLTGHPMLGERFSPNGDGIWDYDDERGQTWTITFDRKIADASGGTVGLFTWGHPAFPST